MSGDSLNEQTALLVHFNDFRLRDNRPLVEAYRQYSRVVSVVVIDPEQFTRTAFGMPRYSARRVAWYLDAIRDLRRGYRERGGELLVRVGRPVSELGRLVTELGAVALFGQGAKTDEESRQLRAIEHGLPNTRCVWQWNDVLVSPENWPVPAWSFPRSFTGFRKSLNPGLLSTAHGTFRACMRKRPSSPVRSQLCRPWGLRSLRAIREA